MTPESSPSTLRVRVGVPSELPPRWEPHTPGITGGWVDPLDGPYPHVPCLRPWDSRLRDIRPLSKDPQPDGRRHAQTHVRMYVHMDGHVPRETCPGIHTHARSSVHTLTHTTRCGNTYFLATLSLPLSPSSPLTWETGPRDGAARGLGQDCPPLTSILFQSSTPRTRGVSDGQARHGRGGLLRAPEVRSDLLAPDRGSWA